jgi:hypothetical protein
MRFNCFYEKEYFMELKDNEIENLMKFLKEAEQKDVDFIISKGWKRNDDGSWIFTKDEKYANKKFYLYGETDNVVKEAYFQHLIENGWKKIIIRTSSEAIKSEKDENYFRSPYTNKIYNLDECIFILKEYLNDNSELFVKEEAWPSAFTDRTISVNGMIEGEEIESGDVICLELEEQVDGSIHIFKKIIRASA